MRTTTATASCGSNVLRVWGASRGSGGSSSFPRNSSQRGRNGSSEGNAHKFTSLTELKSISVSK